MIYFLKFPVTNNSLQGRKCLPASGTTKKLNTSKYRALYFGEHTLTTKR